jgi:protein-L-isoaspartate O-methyltransferase
MRLALEYFEKMYAASDDPWDFEKRWYDRRKYAMTLASLRHERYASAYEPACSIGVLSHALAPRCDALLCTELVGAAVDRARSRLAGLAHVRVEQQDITDAWPDGQFDLIVLSEILYYFDAVTASGILTRAAAGLAPGGDLVLVHWRHPVVEHIRTGQQSQDQAADIGELARVAHYDDADFLLDVYARQPPEPASVAQRDGLVG